MINKSKQVLKSKAEEENSRARAIEAEEKANSARYVEKAQGIKKVDVITCLLYTSPSPRDGLLSRMPSSA